MRSISIAAGALAVALLVGCPAGGPEDKAPATDQPGAPGGLQNGSFTANLNGFAIHYEVHGQGPVLMAVTNSWGFTAEGLRALLRPLEERLTLVYFDPRGMGGSGPVREEADMGLAAVRADFDALRRHLGLEQVNAIGWSNGAMNLVLLAAEQPETIRSAIFVHGAASYTAEDMAAFARQYPELMQAYQAFMEEMQDPALSDDQRSARMKALWLEKWFPMACADQEKGPAMLQKVFGGLSFSWPHADYSNRESPSFDARDRLPAITARCLVIAGTHDTMPVAKSEELHQGLAQSTLMVFEASGHFSPQEEPEAFKTAVFEFLGVG